MQHALNRVINVDRHIEICKRNMIGPTGAHNHISCIKPSGNSSMDMSRENIVIFCHLEILPVSMN